MSIEPSYYIIYFQVFLHNGKSESINATISKCST